MKIKNWVAVQAVERGAGKAQLPIGGYVVKIVDINDDIEKETFEIVWDVAEGEHAGHYNDEFGLKNTWMHNFKLRYDDEHEGEFKHFLDCLEQSNQGKFSISYWCSEQGACNCAMFRGMLIGVVLQKKIYVSDRGENKGKTMEASIVGKITTAGKIRAGDFEELKPWDTRTDAQKKAAEQTSSNPGGLTEAEKAYAANVNVPF